MYIPSFTTDLVFEQSNVVKPKLQAFKFIVPKLFHSPDEDLVISTLINFGAENPGAVTSICGQSTIKSLL